MAQHDERPLELAQRQVIEAQARVAAQVALIAEMDRQSYSKVDEEILLAELKETLQRCQDELARQRARAGE